MGGGGLMQLVAYGMQDVYLTGNSQITFFKNLYRRHTNFSCEAVEQTFQSNSRNFGNKLVAVVSRNGDLLHRLWIEVTLKETVSSHHYVSTLGHALIKSAEVEIGGQRIDKIYGRFCHLWHKLSCKAEKEAGYELMTGNDGPSYQGKSSLHLKERKLYIPLDFWFSKGSAGAALPLIALQYHEVRITIELADIDEVYRSTDTSSGGGSESTEYTKADGEDTPTMAANPRLYSDFFYLDTDERRRFSQMSHEYLIEQLQFTGSEVTAPIGSATGVSFQMRLNFNHPCKAIYWTTEDTERVKKNINPYYNGHRYYEVENLKQNLLHGTYGEYHDNTPVDSVSLQLNGHDRFSTRDGTYFQWVQPYQHHTRVPHDHYIGMYSFCLSPEEHQPSGALNFSRIDNAVLKLTLKKGHESRYDLVTSDGGGENTDNDTHTRTVYVYAINYNVLRILSGMGGLAFSN